MTGVFVKICGLRDASALDAAIDGRADAVGFVFAPGSRRLIDPRVARSLVDRTPPGIETVGVFRNQPIDEVLESARLAGVTTVQLHGDEPRRDFDRLAAEGYRTIRALSSGSFRRIRLETPEDLTGHRLLIDAENPGEGKTFDTTALVGSRPPGFWLLAGGLNPGNVAAAVASTSADGVDVSSGVESSPGVKDVDLIRRFIAAARTGRTVEPAATQPAD